MASYSPIITSGKVIIHVAGGQILKMAVSCFVDVSEEKMVSQQILTTVMTISLSARVQTMLNHIRFVSYHNIKDNKRNRCHHLSTIQNTDSDLKVHALHYANELLSKTFSNSLNMQKQ